MKIMTKEGDDGCTFLYMGGRVKKDHIRIEACGAIDELCSFLGLAKSLISDKKRKKIIESIQEDLFLIGHEVTTPQKYAGNIRNRLGASQAGVLEKLINKLGNVKKNRISGFCIPGENLISSILDVARTSARRAERIAVCLNTRHMINNRYIVIYLNRLSSLLYILARSYEKKARTISFK